MERIAFGRFRDLQLLGKGGMGEVFLARAVGPRGFEKPVVLKRMHAELARTPDLVERFLREAKLQAQLVCPNIVQVLDFGSLDDSYFLVLEYVHGVDLAVVLKLSGSPLPVGVAVRIATDLCRGLDYAHRARGPKGDVLGLVHRDVSPHNVLVSYEGDIKLADFGLVRAAGSEPLSAGIVYGKPAFVPPEQARGLAVDGRSDLFSLGTLLYTMLAGVQPFLANTRSETLARVAAGDAEPLENLCPQAPPELTALVRCAMQSDPVRRFPDAATMLTELEGIALSLGPTATTRSVKQEMQQLFPGAAERDPWAGPARPVPVELARLMADEGQTRLTAIEPSTASPPRRSRRGWAIGLALLLMVAGSIAIASLQPNGPEGSSQRQAQPARPPRTSRPLPPIKSSDHAVEAVKSATPPGPAPEPAPPVVRPSKRQITASRALVDAGAVVQPPSPSPDAAAVPRPTGRLRVGATPGWGWVAVDGQRVGTTPLQIELPAGSHAVTVVGARSGREHRSQVQVEPGHIASVYLESFE